MEMEKALDLLGIHEYDVIVDKYNVHLNQTVMSRRSFLIMSRKKKKAYKNKVVVLFLIPDDDLYIKLLKPSRYLIVRLESSFPCDATTVLPIYRMHGDMIYMYSLCDDNVKNVLQPIFTY